MTIQLIGKDDSSFGDSEVLTGRWQAYIDSYVSVRIYAASIDQLLIFISFLHREKIRRVSPKIESDDLICGGKVWAVLMLRNLI
jgi:hypothetical protein